MQMLQLPLIQKRHLVGLTAAMLLTLGFCVALSARAAGPTPIEGDSGPWRNAVSAYNCQEIQAGTVCAEWPSQAANTVTVCCVDPEVVGTYQGSGTSCYVVLGERAFN